MKSGQVVPIYEQPLTEECYEGDATLIRPVLDIGVFDGRPYRRWRVRFQGERRVVERNILEPVETE